MHLIKSSTVLVLVFILCQTNSLKAQESINSAGAVGRGEGGTLHYSVGQVMYVNRATPSGSIQVGVQHAFVSSVVSGFENESIRLRAMVYPNPTSKELKLEVAELESFKYQLLDMGGNILESKSVYGKSAVIDMVDRPSGIYLIKVISLGNIVKSFKVLKN